MGVMLAFALSWCRYRMGARLNVGCFLARRYSSALLYCNLGWAGGPLRRTCCVECMSNDQERIVFPRAGCLL